MIAAEDQQIIVSLYWEYVADKAKYSQKIIDVIIRQEKKNKPHLGVYLHCLFTALLPYQEREIFSKREVKMKTDGQNTEAWKYVIYR